MFWRDFLLHMSKKLFFLIAPTLAWIKHRLLESLHGLLRRCCCLRGAAASGAAVSISRWSLLTHLWRKVPPLPANHAYCTAVLQRVGIVQDPQLTKHIVQQCSSACVMYRSLLVCTPSRCVSGRSPKQQLRESRDTVFDRATSHHVLRLLASPWSCGHSFFMFLPLPPCLSSQDRLRLPTFAPLPLVG